MTIAVSIAPAVPGPITTTSVINVDLTWTMGDTLTRAILFVQYVDGSTEVIRNGNSYTNFFSPLSTETVLAANSRRFSVARSGGWQKSPTFYVHGNTNTGETT